MLVKTFGRGFRFVLVLGLLLGTATSLWGKPIGSKPKGSKASGSGGDTRESARVTISVYNDADVPVDVLSRAEGEARQVFQLAGIEVDWLNCKAPAMSEEVSRSCREAAFPEHLHLRIVRRSLGTKAEAMGISFQGEDGKGCYADLFYEPMEQLHRSDGTDVASLLGHAAAHEIGHLLLGLNSHSPAGIMQAHWTAAELTFGNEGRMVFLEKEARRMRSKLATASQDSKGGLSNEIAAIPARTGD